MSEYQQRRVAGRRILVVGSSSGIGNLIAHSLCAEGAHVAFCGRRGDLCESEAKSAAGTAIGVECDVTTDDGCDRAVAETVERLGGLDDVVYAAGAIAMISLAEADASWWRQTFGTNVMGPSLITRAALAHVRAGDGSFVYISSVAAEGAPWPGVSVYGTTKAALNRLVDCWRSEHPDVGFVRISIGPTAGGATRAMVHESAFAYQATWGERRVQPTDDMIPPESVARLVRDALIEPKRIWSMSIHPR